MTRLDSDRLDEVQRLGEEYSKAHQECMEVPAGSYDKTRLHRIVDIAATFNALEMAVFCQEVVSHFDDVHKASMCLTVLANRVHWTPTED